MYKKLFDSLNRKRGEWKTEEEVRLGWLHEIQKELGITFHAERGRSDASYNRVIIEFKDKGLFHGKETSPKFKEAVFDRLAKYISAKAELDGCDPSDYIGIGIDGDHVIFAYYRGESISHGNLMPLSEASVSLVAEACRDSIRRAVTADNLIEDFGHFSVAGRGLMQVLNDVLSAHLTGGQTTKIKMLFEEWRTLYGQVANLSGSQIRTINGSIGFSCALPDHVRIPAILFVIHTYNSLLIKLIAAEVVSELASLTAYSGFAQASAPLSNDDLINRLQQDIERAGLYSRSGIKGFVEEAIFGWYVDGCSDAGHKKLIADAIREVLVKLALYRTDNLSVARSNDVLKHFYQDLVPDVLRKSLGEFYTPDWLVDVALDKVERNDWLTIRFLDPTCGSASFLLAAIRRIRAAATIAKWDKERLLRHIIDNVWGFDLNPLAVQAARVNFLIAIADLIQANPGADVELPILLADAVYSPAKDPNSDEPVVEYQIGSNIANLRIKVPSDLAFNRERLDKVFEVMGESVEDDETYDHVRKKLVARRIVSLTEAKEWDGPLSETYNRVLALHGKNWNGIWFRIVRNFFWSATAGSFDVVAGNPPWVRWSKLPELYRERVKPTCEQYSIFSNTPHHGGNELDISGMITYTVADKWLKESGQLVFVITQTHFQSPSSQGFRLFNIDGTHSLSPKSVDDLKSIKPFPDAANKTSIFSALKTKRKPKYPVPYSVWQAADGYTKNIPVTLSKADVLARVVIENQEANPVGGKGSPWAIMPVGQFSSMQKLTGRSAWVQGRKGITCDRNGIYFVQIVAENPAEGLVQIETRPGSGKTALGVAQRFWVEPDLLYPLLKGAADISPCRFQPVEELYAFVPNKGIVKQAYQDADNLITSKLHRTYKYFKTFKSELESRSTFRGRMKNAPFYAIYNVGEYTFSPWKVVWAEQPGNKAFPAAVIGTGIVPLLGERVVIPDHKIFFVDFDDPEPACYLCGLLNCSTVRMFIHSHNISIQIGNIFKHMSLPKFDKANKAHVELARLVRQAHAERNGVKLDVLLYQISNLGNTLL